MDEWREWSIRISFPWKNDDWTTSKNKIGANLARAEISVWVKGWISEESGHLTTADPPKSYFGRIFHPPCYLGQFLTMTRRRCSNCKTSPFTTSIGLLIIAWQCRSNRTCKLQIYTRRGILPYLPKHSISFTHWIRMQRTYHRPPRWTSGSLTTPTSQRLPNQRNPSTLHY